MWTNRQHIGGDYNVAFLTDNAPSSIRIGMATTENDAAHRALRVANECQCDTCVVDDRGNIVQTVRYRPPLVEHK